MAKQAKKTKRPATTVSAGDVLRTYNRLLRGFRWPYVLVIAIIATASAVGLVFPWLYKLLFDLMANPAGATPEAVRAAVQVVVWMIVAQAVSYVTWRSSGFFSVWMGTKAEARLQASLFTYLIRHSYRFFTNQFAGAIIRKANRFVSALDKMSDLIKWDFVPLAVILIGSSIALTLYLPVLGAIMVGWVVLYLFVNYRLGMWKLQYDLRQYEADSKAAGMFADIITNAINVKLFSAYRLEENRYRTTINEFIRLWRRSWNISEILMAVQAGLYILLEVGIVYLSVRLWQAGQMSVGDFALVQGYLLQVFRHLWDFGRNLRRMFELTAEAAEMVEILETPHEIQDVKGAKSIVVSQGEVAFHHVSFSYQQERAVLREFDLTIRPGEKVALVGPSGAGKTTVTKLLLRFFEVTAGQILIDGQDITRVTLDSLWHAISFVPQDPILFHRSLMENIRYGRPDATEQEVIAAAKKARCHDFISALPKGYGTFVGERGVKLSGGERQRVAIARAILKNAPILVLDEATSSLDSESELLIQESLAELMKGKTVIVIAHRLSTIMKMDRIAVMQDGIITEMGTHTQLLKEVGTYQRLWQIQAGGFQR